MFDTAGLTTAQILDVFTSEVSAHGGQVTDTFDDGRRLFTGPFWLILTRSEPATSSGVASPSRRLTTRCGCILTSFDLSARMEPSWLRPSSRITSPIYTYKKPSMRSIPFAKELECVVGRRSSRMLSAVCGPQLTRKPT